MLKAVLFDMDGVLIDSEPEYKRVEYKLCRDLGFVLSEEDKKRFVGCGAIITWTIFKEKYGFPQEPAEIVEMEGRVMADYYMNGELVPIGIMVDLLKQCSRRGLTIAVATSSAKKSAEAVIERIGIKGYVDAVVSGEMAKNPKPAPDVFLLTAELLGVLPEECVVIEDSKNGIASAKEAGIKALGFKTRENEQDLSGADIIISETGISVEELISAFQY